MRRALLKGAALLAFGRTPGGARAYRALTRGVLGTFATHVDKLARVWPGYARVWQAQGVALEGKDLWIHEGGETVYAPLAVFLVSGRAGVMTDRHGGVLDRYLSRSVDGVLATDLGCVPAARRARVEALRWETSAARAVAGLGGVLHANVTPGRVPLASSSVDLCHSGGALEHYRPDELAAFLAEQRRVLRPGGLASHVVDHRDHLHHADARLPFLAHLALPDAAHAALSGHELGYHHRLSPTQVGACFEAAGFERLAWRRLVRVAGQARYVDSDEAALAGDPGLPRRWLAARFRGLSEVDLRTLATHFVYRRR